MSVHVFFAPSEADPAVIADATVVVIDVIRATTTMVEALANGARDLYPLASTEDAVRLAASLGREDTLLCGERKGVKVEGFDLGNSPAECSPDVVGGKRLVMSTTNGTGAFQVASEASRVIACALTNLSAVAASIGDAEKLVVVCAGREGRFALDDVVCAGHLLARLDERDRELNDGARACLALAGAMDPGGDFLNGTAAGKALDDIGLASDLEICADLDRHAVVPEMKDNALTLVES